MKNIDKSGIQNKEY